MASDLGNRLFHGFASSRSANDNQFGQRHCPVLLPK
jgi:hypothetical protein